MTALSADPVLLLAFIGGTLTILSPCIVPVIPLVFARGARSPWAETVPMLAGLALAFTTAALIATTTAHWLLVANTLGRYLALLLLAAIGCSLLSDRVAAAVVHPVTRLGARLLTVHAATPARNVVVGAAIGLLWAPCAGPILGLLIAVAVTRDRAHAALLFLTFATGAAVSIALVLSAAGELFRRLRTGARAERSVRRVLGVATIITVAALFLGWDGALFARAGVLSTTSAEAALVRHLGPAKAADVPSALSLDEFADAERARLAPPPLPSADGPLPPLDGGTAWINSGPLTTESLRGKVVLVDFWTFGCYNCRNALPHVKALYAKYRNRGFVVIGVHTPEFAHERVLDNVRRETANLGIEYPVVVDNDMRIWRAFHNQYWPAAYYADGKGALRFYHFGEGRYDEQDQVVARLLAERDAERVTARKAP